MVHMNLSLNNSRGIDGDIPVVDSNFTLSITKTSISVIGIPLNLFIATLILHRRRLHSKSRNYFLLAVVSSNLLVFLPSFIHLIYWCYPAEPLYQIYIETVDLPPLVLLLNVLLGLIDRSVAIRHPLWYRKKITIRRVRVGFFLLFTSVIVPLLLRFLYIAVGLAPLSRSKAQIASSKLTEWVKIVLFVSCIVINLIVYRQTRNLLRKSNIIEENNTTAINTVDGQSASFARMSIRLDNGIGKEVEIARTWVVVVAVLIVTSCPIVVFDFALQSCLLFSYVKCVDYFNWRTLCVKEIGYLIPAGLNSVVWLVMNDELRSVSKTKTNIIPLSMFE